MTKEKAMMVATKLFRHLWNPKSREALSEWLRLILSWRGLVCVSPCIIGVLFVYWAKAHGYENSLISKGPNEILAVWLMSLATAVFLMRVIIDRSKLNIVLLVVAANFLCREIHFTSTGTAVYVVATIALLLAIYWEDEILDSLKDAKWFQICMTGTIFTYFFAILVQRRVFKAKRLPFLPDEEHMHVPLEEVLENVAHAFLLVSAIVAFFSISSRLLRKLKETSEEPPLQ